jgi:hypothetical protein
MTLEPNCVKIWDYRENSVGLTKRIHIKQAVKQVVVSEMTGFVLILGESGKVLILDQEGQFVSTFNQPGVVFTCIAVANDKLLLGTD